MSSTAQMRRVDRTAWRTCLRKDRDKALLDEENVRLCLLHDPDLAELVAWDAFAEELRLLRPVPGEPQAASHYPRKWTDADTVRLATYLQRTVLPRVAREKVESTLSAHAMSHATFHPVRDYLHGLAWDGTPRLHGFLPDYFGAGPEHLADYLAEVGTCWLVSAVARIEQPGCQADYAIVLEGEQGLLKSSALRMLAGEEYFSDSLPHDLGSKDARDHLRGKWIVELPELAQFRRSEIETVKAFLTRREERYRPAYGRHEIIYRRQCVFAGSTNDPEYLVDPTGNRRFWPVAVAKIDLAALEADRDQLWAEAAALYAQGRHWYLDARTEETAAAETRKRLITDPWHPLVERLVSELPLGALAEVTPGQVLRAMDLRECDRTPQAAKRVAAALSAMSWRTGRKTMAGRMYLRPPQL